MGEDNVIRSFDVFCSCVKNLGKSSLDDPTAKLRPKRAWEVLFSRVSLDLRPNVVNDICAFTEYVRDIRLATELKDYRPLSRPIVVTGANETEKHRRKRKLVVRNWLLFAVWAARLRKKRAERPTLEAANVRELIPDAKKRPPVHACDVDDEEGENRESMRATEKGWNEKFWGTRIRFRFQGVTANFYQKDTSASGPLLELVLGGTAAELYFLPDNWEFSLSINSLMLYELLLNRHLGSDMPSPSTATLLETEERPMMSHGGIPHIMEVSGNALDKYKSSSVAAAFDGRRRDPAQQKCCVLSVQVGMDAKAETVGFFLSLGVISKSVCNI